MKIKPVINKRTGGVNLPLPRKLMPLDLRKDINLVKKIKLKIEGWELI